MTCTFNTLRAGVHAATFGDELVAHLAAPPRGELVRGGVRVALVVGLRA